MLESFCTWLENTSLSAAIQNIGWIIPLGQIIHILCLSIVLSSVVLLDFRIMGLAALRVPIPDMARRFLPWMWSALALMVITGSILVIGEPKRDLLNPAFWTKMLLLLAAATITFLFQLSIRAKAGVWTGNGKGRTAIRLFAAIALTAWIGVAVCGRLIAYFMAG